MLGKCCTTAVVTKVIRVIAVSMCALIYVTTIITSVVTVIILMLKCGNLAIYVRFSTVTCVSCITLFLTLRSCYYRYISMICCRNGCNVSIIASCTCCCCATCFCASRINCYCFFIVTKSVNLICVISVTTSASMLCVTLFCTCGSYYCFCVAMYMRKLGNDCCLYFITVSAISMLCTF